MSETVPKVNAFTAPSPKKNEENKIDQFKKYKIVIPLLFVVSVILGVGGYFYYRNATLQSLQQQEDTFASIPSGLEISPTSGNWNIPQKLKVKNIGSNQKTVTWFLDCWDEKICQDTVGQNILQPGESFEQGLGYICSKWQLDLTTQSVNPTWNSPNDIPDNFQWEWGGVAEKKNDCTQTSPTPSVSPTATPSQSPSSTPSRSPSPTPTRSASPTASPTPSSSPSTSPPIGGPSESPTSTPSPTASATSSPEPSSTSTPGTTTQGSTNPPTQVANAGAEELPKAGVEDYASYIIAVGFFSVVVSLLFLKLKKKLY
jgi:hypothetical protein